MEHKAQLENIKYRNWVRAGLGIKYVKEGLVQFCDNLVNQQHTAILDKVKRKHNLSAVSCGLCDVRTLQPDHVQTKTRQCPLGQTNCNCLRPGGKTSCPSNVCGSIYDEIIKRHASTPPTPYWRNTDAHQWCTEPWAVAKCFINAPGYELKKSVVEFDCSGLLHLLINNIEFHHHIQCVISGNDAFSKVLRHRNAIFHSDNMELDDTDITTYLNDMIELLQDEMEIKESEESKEAVKKLLELKQEKFIITTTDETEIRIAMAAVAEKEKNLEQKIVDAKNLIKVATDESEQQIKKTGSAITVELAKTNVERKEDLKKTELDIKERLEEGEKEIKETLKRKAADSTEMLDQKEKEIKENLRTTEVESKERLNQKETEIKENLKIAEVHSKHELKQKETEFKENLSKTEVETKERLEKKGKEIEEDLEHKGKHILYHLDRKQLAQVQIEPRHSDTSKEAADDLMKVDLHDMPLPSDYERKRADFQEKLIRRYENCVRKVSPVPLKPHRDQGNVSDVYVPPWMTVELKNEESSGLKKVDISLHEICRHNEKTAKHIYVIGDAGTGKSMLTKMLLHCWCVAHSYQESGVDKSDIVKEMNRFNFLFYVSLRHFSDCDSIEKMLEKSYLDPALGDILQNVSGECLILLDGLDEWKPVSNYDSQFLTPGLPGRILDAEYTIITTSRQWKFDTLKINDSEVDRKIKLRGIDAYQVKTFIKKTVKMLNDSFQQQQNKSAEKCIMYLQSRRVSDLCHIPLLLKQLICLWFDDKLQENSKSAIYSNMLALFFEWNTLKTPSKNQEYGIRKQTRTKDSPLPHYLHDFKTLREDTRIIQYLSQLAYENLFAENKETKLTFIYSEFERLNIPNDVIKYCLEMGILTEEQIVSLPASTSQQSLFSFFHKSMQEYLAAVHVASQLKEMLKSRKFYQNVNGVCKTCVRKYFGSCKTVVDILDQSNVLMVLCGLEPQLLTNVSEYIYDVTLVDKMVVEERNTLPENIFSLNHDKSIKDIQMCLFMCIEEVLSSAKNVQTPFNIADINVSCSTDMLRYVENVILKNVLRLSIDVDNPKILKNETHKKSFYRALGRFTKCDHLKVMIYTGTDDMTDNEITNILDTNVCTLETISFLNTNWKIITHLVSILPKMRRLTSLQMRILDIPHDVCLSLCKFLNQNTSLQHISLGFHCKSSEKYMIDLSKHKQLQHVHFMSYRFCLASCNTDNLETYKLSIRSVDMMSQVCNSLYKAEKLRHLTLSGGVCKIENETEYKIITENLIRLLSSLVSLSTLTLKKLTLTSNIIARPCDMTNLKKITLDKVTMNLENWRKFIVSLPLLSQAVTVDISLMEIGDGCRRNREEMPKADARQYVREKYNLFRVTSDDVSEFKFTTRKI